MKPTKPISTSMIKTGPTALILGDGLQVMASLAEERDSEERCNASILIRLMGLNLTPTFSGPLPVGM